LLEDGYLPTENIIAIDNGAGLIEVKEGNRRVAALKIALGLIDKSKIYLPDKLDVRISELTDAWKEANASVPCAIYKPSEADVVDRIVANTHGKGQKAGRDHWEAVARARHNKIKNGISEPALVLLEKYLEHGTNLTIDQKNRWAGRYNLSVLDEAIKKIAPRLGFTSSPELVKQYPAISYKNSLDDVIHAIGIEALSFPAIRDSADFALRFGIPASVAAGHSSTSSSPTSPAGTSATGVTAFPTASGSSVVTAPGAPALTTSPASPARPAAAAINDEKQIKEQDYRGMLFINLSPKALIVGEFVVRVHRLAMEFDIEPSRIVFEITERETVSNLSLLEKFVLDIKLQGFSFAIDDFGSGYSSFQYIKRFPVDYIKIEGEFIRNMLNDEMYLAFIKSIVTLAQELNIKTIAEYVEDGEILAAVSALGIDYAQGYHISRPSLRLYARAKEVELQP